MGQRGRAAQKGRVRSEQSGATAVALNKRLWFVDNIYWMATNNQSKEGESLFCCSCGEKDKSSEVVVDTSEKVPNTEGLPAANGTLQQSDVHVEPVRAYRSPLHNTRVTFTYSSPMSRYRPTAEWAPTSNESTEYNVKYARDGSHSFGSSLHQNSTNSKDSSVRHNRYDLNWQTNTQKKEEKNEQTERLFIKFYLFPFGH
jgi:hypothetical protein